MQTKEQRRAQFALEQITQTFKDDIDEETANFIVGLPTMILSNGLGQSLAFLLSKTSSNNKGQKYEKAFITLQEWLIRNTPELLELARNPNSNNKRFLEVISMLDMRKYIDAQKDALAYLSWLKRYARAFQKDKRD